MTISSTKDLSIPDYFATASRTGLSIDSVPVSLWGPFFALVMAVLAMPIITTSSSLFGASFLPPLKVAPLLALNC